MVLTSIVVVPFVVRLLSLITDEVVLILLTGVVMVVTSVVEFAVVLSTFVVKLGLPKIIFNITS